MSGYLPTLNHSLLILLLALVLAAGDPPNRWYPMAWMGRLIACPGFLVAAGDARATRTEPRHPGILVHDSGSSGLPTFVRVAPRLSKDNRRLLQAWRESVNSRPRPDREGAK